MSRMTATERQLVAIRRKQAGKPQFLPSLRGSYPSYDMGQFATVSIVAAIFGLAIGIVMLCFGLIAGIAPMLGIPFLWGTVSSGYWITRYHKQTNKLRHAYLDSSDYRWGKLVDQGDFTYVYGKIKKCEPTPITAQLAELCGQVTIRSLSMPPVENIADEDKQKFAEWFNERYNEAISLADAIVEYDTEMKLAEKDSNVRADRITASTLVKGLEAETKVRKQLKAQGIDPVGTATDTLKELTTKSREVREHCNVELKKLGA